MWHEVSDCGMECQIVAWSVRMWHEVSDCGMECQNVAWSVRLWHGECQSVA